MFSFLWSLIVGGIIGWIAGMIVGRDIPGGIIGNIVAGFIGANLGTWLFGSWGLTISNFAIFPAIIGAVILVFIVSFVLKMMGSSSKPAH